MTAWASGPHPSSFKVGEMREALLDFNAGNGNSVTSSGGSFAGAFNTGVASTRLPTMLMQEPLRTHKCHAVL